MAVNELIMSKKYGLELIGIAQDAKRQHRETDPDLLQVLEGEYFDACGKNDIPKGLATAFWQGFREELRKRPHLAKFTFDARGCKSLFFPTWVMDIIGQRMSQTMRPAYYEGYTVEGELRTITEDDPFYIWSKYDPVFVYVRARDARANQAMQEGRAKRILNLGAGNCPEIFKLDYDEELLRKQAIHCCDIAETGLLSYLKTKNLPNFRYAQMDMAKFIQEEAGFGPNLIMMKGTLSYRMDALGKVLAIADQLLAPGGEFFFDLQLKHWALLRNLEVFTWGEGTFGLLDSAEMATELIRKTVEAGGLHFEVEEPVERWSEEFVDKDGTAVGVVFRLKKTN